MKTLSLDGKWKLRILKASNLPRGAARVRGWMNAVVPGTVHTDLMANNIIPDPFYRMNETGVQWVDRQQWLYRKEFTVSGALLNEERIILLAEGLDTYADVRLNGKKIGRTENMFIEHRFDVTGKLRHGRNVLEILFDSPEKRVRALEKKFGALRVAHEPQRVYARKAQYSFGWDWGPKLTTSGIWKSISIRACSGGVIEDPFVRIVSAGAREAVVEITATLGGVIRNNLVLRAAIEGPSGGAATAGTAAKPVSGSRATLRMTVPDPEIWWPNGYGDQPVYRAKLSLCEGKKVLHESEVPFGIRTVRLLQERDTEGKSFVLEVNGTKIFCKGADWIPSDTFLPRISDGTYSTLLGMAKDAHMNMVRVWGGGIYEKDIFYNLCDEMGLMVWQDFMYACGEYPQGPWFLKQAREEAAHVVRRLRNHPSIVLWCGNNECEWLFCTENPDKTPDDMKGAVIFRRILRDACAEFDGTRPYWRSSPFGTGFPNDESNGNHHEWVVWSGWKDFRDYEKVHARFVTEFGFQGPANRATFERVTVPSDRETQSRVMEHHNKQGDGTERLLRFVAAHYRIPESFDDFILTGQLTQAEALKTAVEHWRRRKFATAGSIFWQLNDCWPVTSWAVVDSALRPKAAWYYAKKFFDPVLISFKRVAGGVEVWGTNDLLDDVRLGVEIRLRSFSGRTLWKKRMKCLFPRNSSGKILALSEARYGFADPASHYLYAALIDGVGGKLETRHFFREVKHLALPKPSVSAAIGRAWKEFYMIELKAKSFAKNVAIDLGEKALFFEDNFFDMDAGSVRRVVVKTTGRGPLRKKDLSIRALANL